MKTNTAAFITAAGRGTRMGNLTQFLPKPLLILNGKPIISYLSEYLINSTLFSSITITLGYLESQWEGYRYQYKDSIIFRSCSESDSIIQSFLSITKKINADNILAISGDVIFDFHIIESAIRHHILSEADVTVALNHSSKNQGKKWDYIIHNSDLVDIIPRDYDTHFERYFFIIRKSTLDNFTLEMELNNKYSSYNSGWSGLNKMLIDRNKYLIKSLFFECPIFNINTPAELSKAESYMVNGAYLSDTNAVNNF